MRVLVRPQAVAPFLGHLRDAVSDEERDVQKYRTLAAEAREVLTGFFGDTIQDRFVEIAEQENIHKNSLESAIRAVEAYEAVEKATHRPPGELPVVSFKTVTEGLGIPGERRKIAGYPRVPASTAEKYLEEGDYYLDERLKELRLVRDPSVMIRLNDFEVEWFKERAR